MSNNVFKSSFVSIAELKRTIPVVEENHHRILGGDSPSKILSEKSLEEVVKEPELIREDLAGEDSLESDLSSAEDDIPVLSEDELAYDRIMANEVEDQQVGEGELGLGDEETSFSEDVLNLPSMTLKLAKEEAELLIRDAKNRAFEMEREAHERGYQEGLRLGEEKYKSNLESERLRLIEKEENLEYEFRERLRSYEPKIASIIGRLVTQLVGSSDDENIILFLVRLALAENTSKGKVVVNVSDEDFEKVRLHFEDSEHHEDKVSIEIRKNDSLSRNDCLLETDFGVIDSSLSVRLASFLKEMNVIKESLKNINDV